MPERPSTNAFGLIAGDQAVTRVPIRRAGELG